MPCYDPETHDAPIRYSAKINRLTQYLCKLCSAVENSNPDYLSRRMPDVNDWWVEHKRYDDLKETAVRKVKENGVGSLSHEERCAYYDSKHFSPDAP